jgi:hypothetical protein
MSLLDFILLAIGFLSGIVASAVFLRWPKERKNESHR